MPSNLTPEQLAERLRECASVEGVYERYAYFDTARAAELIREWASWDGKNLDQNPFSAEASKSGKSFLLVGLNERVAPGTQGYVSVWVNRLNRAYHMGVSAERRRLGSLAAQREAQQASKLTALREKGRALVEAIRLGQTYNAEYQAFAKELEEPHA